MSGISILKSSLVAASCLAGLTLTACASGASSSRYGSVYDYESGGNCNSGPCGAVVTPPVSGSRYGTPTTVIGGQPVAPGVVYANCSQVSGMNCGVAPAPAPVPMPAPAPTYTGGPVSCPAGTTPNGDGTCMMSGSTGYTSSTSTYSGPTTSYSGETLPCPAGTTPNGDGTCMQSSSGYTSSYSSSSSSVVTSSSGDMADCPTGTTRAGDGTCMMSSGGNVEIYSGSSGYTPPSTYTPPTSYLPIRK
ncbi:MAG TPA: hypothetical protein ENJ42_05630 [Hellea balneolensis]|uniref:Uncharacterized protein n=1 Tax=Hellea balneolensis TaxID=287478 RepID=A0A7C5QRZ5_9PROT|nr:hypothetical protein [Hellea balneolensis]